MVCAKSSDPLVHKIVDLHDKISKLESLSPSKSVDALFTELVSTCIPPHPIDVSNLCPKMKLIRSDLIRLCGLAEGLMEKHYSALLGSHPTPLDHLPLFPYHSNYLKLARAEFDLLSPHCPDPALIAFVGSGPLPLTSILLASNHLTTAVFHNYDVDPSANQLAEKLVAPHLDLSRRMEFRTTDIVDAPGPTLREYDVIFLAALVGVDVEEKRRVVGYLAEHMRPGAVLVVRSARGARAFLYPVVGPKDLEGFEVLSVYHPTDDVINSVVVARKCSCPEYNNCVDKCGELHVPLISQMKMVEEFACQENAC